MRSRANCIVSSWLMQGLESGGVKKADDEPSRKFWHRHLGPNAGCFPIDLKLHAQGRVRLGRGRPGEIWPRIGISSTRQTNRPGDSQ